MTRWATRSPRRSGGTGQAQVAARGERLQVQLLGEGQGLAAATRGDLGIRAGRGPAEKA